MDRHEILHSIDTAIAPDKMTALEALMWLDSLAVDIESRIEGLRDDLLAKARR